MTGQNVVDAVSQDIRKLLASSGADATILLDYVNRIHLDICERKKWSWMRSAPVTFVTHTGVTDYYLGSGSPSAHAFNTGYALTDIRTIDPQSIRDRSNNRKLTALKNQEDHSDFYETNTWPRLGAPKHYQVLPFEESADTLRLSPAPDNLNTTLLVPNPPATGTSVSGALAARYYFIKLTYVDSRSGESTSSVATRQYVPANSVLVVKSPPALPANTAGSTVPVTASGVTYNQWRVYVSETEGSETLQATTNIGTSWTEPGSGLVAGAALPTTNTLEPVRGYVIEFRYYKTNKQITALADVLLVPDDYKDVVIAGVNWYASQYLEKPEAAATWFNVYQAGLRRMIVAAQVPVTDFIRPA